MGAIVWLATTAHRRWRRPVSASSHDHRLCTNRGDSGAGGYAATPDPPEEILLRRPAPAQLHTAIDRAVRWRLGASAYDTAGEQPAGSLAAEAFWADTLVHDPAALRVVGDWPHRDSRELRLEGPSRGAGGHPGAATLIATAQLNRHAAPGTPLILVIHGYAIPVPVWDVLQARALRRAGAHTMLIDLPHHLRRRVPGRRSGDGFFGADPARTLASVRQSVEDAAALVAWARREVTPVVGVLGVSLGALVGLLLATQVELDALVAVAPFCDPPSTFLEQLPANARRRLGLRGDAGGTWGADRRDARDRLNTALAPIIPRNLAPRTPADRITLVRPLHDLIVGQQPIADLASAWGVEMWDYPSGHITVMNAPGIGGRLRDRVLASAAASRSVSSPR